MPKYTYKARDWSGKLIKGELELASKKDVFNSIKDNGLIPLSIEERSNSMISELRRKIKGKVGSKEVSTFTRQLSTMMTAGLPLTDALTLLQDQQEEDSGLSQVIKQTLKQVRGGMPLGKALEEYKNIFGEAYIASVSAGEEAGVLDDILEKLAKTLEDQNEFQGKVKGAMIYPVIVIIAMIVVAFVMMIFVIPKMTSMYADFGTAKMPAITQALMNVSYFVGKVWFVFPILVVILYFAYKAGMANENFHYKRDKFLIKIPIMGRLTEKSILANTTRTMSMLLTAGITLVEALKIVASVAGNMVYERAYLDIAEKVQKGFSVAVSFENTGIFPPLVNQMISTGEATGKLDEVLLRVSEYFSKEAEEAVKALTSAIEPLIMVVLGIGVGFLVVAVIMPIYTLTSSF
ncbi:MAG: type II secretion system F family protein [Candidatus Shapirobacteria bacterium]